MVHFCSHWQNFQKPAETENQREPHNQVRCVTQNKNNSNYNINENNRSYQGKPFCGRAQNIYRYWNLFYKATAIHQYLNFKLCYLTHTKRNIPHNLARRFCSILTDKNIKNQRLAELNVLLSAQNYPEKLILSAI